MKLLALALVLCVAAIGVCAVDPFIADAESTRAPTPTPPTPQPLKPLPSTQLSPSPGAAAAGPVTAAPVSAPTPTPAPGAAPKPGEAAVPQAKGAGDAAVPVPVATGPAKPIVSSPALNITAVPTTAPAPVKRGEAVDTKKSGAAALFDVKAGGTHVAISPSGDVMVRNPDVDVNTVRVVQMIAGIVQAVKRVIESAKPARKEPAHVPPRAKEEESDDNGDEKEENESDSKGTGGGDADGVAERRMPLPAELDSDSISSADTTRPFIRRDGLVDDTKPYARKLHYRVRRNYSRGGGDSSVGDVRFDHLSAPITMQLQQISTIPRSEFAPDSYRFAVDVPGRPTFYVDLPQRA